jgi:hypothetical protein
MPTNSGNFFENTTYVIYLQLKYQRGSATEIKELSVCTVRNFTFQQELLISANSEDIGSTPATYSNCFQSPHRQRYWNVANAEPHIPRVSVELAKAQWHSSVFQNRNVTSVWNTQSNTADTVELQYFRTHHLWRKTVSQLRYLKCGSDGAVHFPYSVSQKILWCMLHNSFSPAKGLEVANRSFLRKVVTQSIGKQHDRRTCDGVLLVIHLGLKCKNQSLLLMWFGKITQCIVVFVTIMFFALTI